MSAYHRHGVLQVFLSLACAVLASCSSTSSNLANPVNWLTPYKVDVIQGNFISKEQVEQLRAGMPRDQVKAVLGTPLLASLFHADRWDYVFTLKRQGTEPQSYKYTVFFKNEVLERFEGDDMPSENEFISRLANKRKLGKVPVLEATEEQLKSAAKSAAKPVPNTPTEPSDPRVAPAMAYPPLEGPRR